MIASYKTLQAGDVRKQRDEVRRTTDSTERDFKSFTDWQPVTLIGEIILESDLIVAEFRRPLL